MKLNTIDTNSGFAFITDAKDKVYLFKPPYDKKTLILATKDDIANSIQFLGFKETNQDFKDIASLVQFAENSFIEANKKFIAQYEDINPLSLFSEDDILKAIIYYETESKNASELVVLLKEIEGLAIYKTSSKVRNEVNKILGEIKSQENDRLLFKTTYASTPKRNQPLTNVKSPQKQVSIKVKSSQNEESLLGKTGGPIPKPNQLLTNIKKRFPSKYSEKSKRSVKKLGDFVKTVNEEIIKEEIQL